MSNQRFIMTTLLVPDYDAGITFYVEQLGFDLVEDSDVGGGKRWVVVSPGGEARLLLAKASDDAQRAAIGNQTGGRVGFVLQTDDLRASHSKFLLAGVEFEEEPRHELYGSVAVFRDPFGNRWDMIEFKEAA